MIHLPKLVDYNPAPEWVPNTEIEIGIVGNKLVDTLTGAVVMNCSSMSMSYKPGAHILITAEFTLEMPIL